MIEGGALLGSELFGGAAAGEALGAGIASTALPAVGATFGGGAIGAGIAGDIAAGDIAAGIGGGLAAGDLAAQEVPRVTVTGEAPPASGVGGTAAGGAAGALAGGLSGASQPSVITAANPIAPLSSDTAAMLGVGTLDVGGIPGTTTGMVPGGADVPFDTVGTGTDLGTPMDYSSPQPGMLDQASEVLKKLGLTPATAAMLGLSGAQALSIPKLPAAAKTLSDVATPGAQAASATIQSGGTSSPAWTTQKSSIDAAIDQQITQQSEAMLQQAVNSGQGADSQVTLQQINKLKNDLETKRQQLYAEAQAQNVQAALSELGISDQALAQVANAQFAGSNEAKSSAAQTASLALMLQALSKGA